jgi:hypothetical protein
MHTIQTDRPNPEHAPYQLLVLTIDDIKEASKPKALDENISLFDDFTITMHQKHTSDVILYFRPDGKMKIFKNRYGFDGNLY